VPEQETAYPEFPSFHPLPSWAFFIRHVRRLKIRSCEITSREPDARPAFHVEDVSSLTLQETTINGKPHETL
jgi:hypothetical protein